MADIAWLIHACVSVVFYAIWFTLFPVIGNALLPVLAFCGQLKHAPTASMVDLCACFFFYEALQPQNMVLHLAI